MVLSNTEHFFLEHVKAEENSLFDGDGKLTEGLTEFALKDGKFH